MKTNEITFDKFEADGWGLFINNNHNSNTAKSITLGTDGGNIELNPRDESQTSGFVNWHHDNGTTEYLSNDIPIGIISNDSSLTIKGTLGFLDNASLYSSSGDVLIENLKLVLANLQIFYQ